MHCHVEVGCGTMNDTQQLNVVLRLLVNSSILLNFLSVIVFQENFKAKKEFTSKN